jgi:hypothetical protein
MNNYALLQSCRWFRSSRISQEINKSLLAAHSQPMYTCSDGRYNIAGRNTGCLRAQNVFLFLLLLARPTQHIDQVTIRVLVHSRRQPQRGAPRAKEFAALLADPFVVAVCRSEQVFQTLRPLETRVLLPLALSVTLPAAVALNSLENHDDSNILTPTGLRPLALLSLL